MKRVAAYCPDHDNATTLAASLVRKGNEVVVVGSGEDLQATVDVAVEQKVDLVFTTKPYAPYFRRHGLNVFNLKPRSKSRAANVRKAV